MLKRQYFILLVCIRDILGAFFLSTCVLMTVTVILWVCLIVKKRDTFAMRKQARRPHSGNSLLSNDPSQSTLLPGEYIFSSDGNFLVTYQAQGNLVMYPKAIWSSPLPPTTAGRAVMQSDGKLVLYDKTGKPYWSTDSPSGKGPFRMTVQQDRNLVVYDSTNNVQWASHTVTPEFQYGTSCTSKSC